MGLILVPMNWTINATGHQISLASHWCRMAGCGNMLNGYVVGWLHDIIREFKITIYSESRAGVCYQRDFGSGHMSRIN